MQKQISALELQQAIINGLQIKIAAHTAAKGVIPADVQRSVKSVSLELAQFLIDCEKSDFAQWVETAPVKSTMRAIKFASGVAHLVENVGGDKVAQALILTARTLNTDTLPLELVKHQLIAGHEIEELSTMTKGRSIRNAARKMGKNTALSMISNRCGKNGYMQFFGMVSRSDDKAVVVNKQSPFYKAASKLLKGKGETVNADAVAG